MALKWFDHWTTWAGPTSASVSRRHPYDADNFTRVRSKIMKIIFFDMSQSNLCGHSLKLNKKTVRLDVAKFSFSNRVLMNGISWTRKLFRDVHWLVLNGN